MDFEYYHAESKRLFKNLQATPENHIDLCYFIREFDGWMEVLEHETIYVNGGDDGPVATEMYRMLMTLHEKMKN